MSAPKTLPLPSAVLWDMDGTLIDQTASIVGCYAEVVASMGYPIPDADVIRRSLGGPMASTMSLFIKESELDEASKRFRARFPEMMFEGMIICEGGQSLIDAFAEKGIPQAIFTNKHGDTARQLSAHVRFDQKISVCIGNTDTEWHKPQAKLTQYVLNQINASAENACMIGDSPTDIETAHNAGLVCYCVSTGAHSVTELKDAGAEAAFESLIELKAAFAI
ncbi:MAG: HAD family hydrolase [Opitutaceae bacterium]